MTQDLYKHDKISFVQLFMANLINPSNLHNSRLIITIITNKHCALIQSRMIIDINLNHHIQAQVTEKKSHIRNLNQTRKKPPKLSLPQKRLKRTD